MSATQSRSASIGAVSLMQTSLQSTRGRDTQAASWRHSDTAKAGACPRGGGRRLRLPHGSCLVMRGKTQQCWLHQLPKTRAPVGPRINLTFRRMVGEPPAVSLVDKGRSPAQPAPRP